MITNRVIQWLALRLWCLTPLSIKNIQLYRGGHVLLLEEIGVPGENLRPVASH